MINPSLTWEGRSVLAIFFILFCMVAQAFPYAQWLGYPIYPHIPLLVVYYWSVFRPAQANPFLLFALGLVQDVLTGAPLGLYAATLLILRSVIASQRRLFLAQQFMFVWAGMAITQLIALGAHYAVMQFTQVYGASISTMLLPAAVTVLCYPLWHKAMDAFYKDRQMP